MCIYIYRKYKSQKVKLYNFVVVYPQFILCLVTLNHKVYFKAFNSPDKLPYDITKVDKFISQPIYKHKSLFILRVTIWKREFKFSCSSFVLSVLNLASSMANPASEKKIRKKGRIRYSKP